MANSFDGATQIPEIWETEEDKKLEIKQLKSKYTKYAYNEFVKEPALVLLNHHTKWKIEVTTRVVREWWKKSRTRPRIIAIQLSRYFAYYYGATGIEI